MASRHYETTRSFVNNSNLHVADVVDVQRLLQTNHQPRSVELHREDRVTVAVLTYFCPWS